MPATITNCGIEKELRKFMDDAGDVYHKTGMPLFPCIFGHFCVPFGPICLLLHCMNKRKSQLEDLMEEFNKETGA